jgi:ferric iron reductase protein FhuF
MLAPIEASLAAMRARLGETATHGIHRHILVDRHGPVDSAYGWVPATRLVDGSRVPQLIDTAKQRWGAQPHAAAALAWKSYSYWLTLPAVVGYAAARRVPLPHPENVLVDFHDHQPFLTIGLARPAVAVLPSDPLAATDMPGIRVVRDEAALLGTLRESLLDAHLDPLLERLRERVHLGRRTLLGSVASGVAYGLTRARAHADPDATIAITEAVLDALGLGDLVDLVIDKSGLVSVQRRTCCLAFTLPVPKICRGCVLTPPAR